MDMDKGEHSKLILLIEIIGHFKIIYQNHTRIIFSSHERVDIFPKNATMNDKSLLAPSYL